MENQRTDLLIIGAGPFGLSLAALAKHLGVDHVVLGRPMEFWKANMPRGMLLRSACDWHLDPLDEHTIERSLAMLNLTSNDVEPLSLEFYLDYAAWFVEQKQIATIPRFVQRLDYVEGDGPAFTAALDDGGVIAANRVVVAVGFRHFKHVPDDLAALLPARRYSHTCDLVDFESLRNRRCLIVGGRQSALEWAALLHEAGAAAVHVCHRHPTPAFAEADWSWVDPLIDAMVDNPGWFRNLPPAEKEAINHRFWAEGRLKAEPWLAPRLDHETIKFWPNTQVGGCHQISSGELAIQLDSGDTLAVDHVIFATGYKVNISRVPFLANGNILARLNTDNGYPVLDEHLQTNLPGLFITSMPAVQDFGLFFAFTVSVRASARLIAQAIV